MAKTAIRLTRAQLAKFLPDHESIRIFEQLMTDVFDTLPSAAGVETEVLQNQIDLLIIDVNQLQADLPSDVANLQSQISSNDTDISTAQQNIVDNLFQLESKPFDIPMINGSNIQVGSYLPTTVSVANIQSITLSTLYFQRIFNTVNVFGKIIVDPVVSGATTFRLSLPIASNFTTDSQAAGTMTSTTSTPTVAPLISDVTNNQFIISFSAPTASAITFYLNASYLIT